MTPYKFNVEDPVKLKEPASSNGSVIESGIIKSRHSSNSGNRYVIKNATTNHQVVVKETNLTKLGLKAKKLMLNDN